MRKELIKDRLIGRITIEDILPKGYQPLCDRTIKVYFYDGSKIITIESKNGFIDNKIKEFEQMVKLMKKYGTEIIMMIDKERISIIHEEIYLFCKIAEDAGIEIKFIKNKISSKDVIKEYESSILTGKEMNL